MTDRCCNNPNLYRAYVPCWPFAADYCAACDEVTLHGGITGFLFEHLIAPFWDGTMKLTNKKVNR